MKINGLCPPWHIILLYAYFLSLIKITLIIGPRAGSILVSWIGNVFSLLYIQPGSAAVSYRNVWSETISSAPMSRVVTSHKPCHMLQRHLLGCISTRQTCRWGKLLFNSVWAVLDKQHKDVLSIDTGQAWDGRGIEG